MSSPAENNINQPASVNKYIFGNFGGLISDKYIKYANLIAIECICIFVFAIYHYFALMHYDPDLLKYEKFTTKKFYHLYVFWRALLNSINYQATANYTPIQFKHLIPQTVITIQLVSSLALVFFFLTV